MLKIKSTSIISVLSFLLLCKISIAQTVIDYQVWTSVSGCNIFSDPNDASKSINVPVTINGINDVIPHYTTIGQPVYDNSFKSVNLDSRIVNGSTNHGTEYRTTVNFKQGYTYKIIITAIRIKSTQTGSDVLLRLDLNSGGSGGNNLCTGTGVIDANGSGNLKQSKVVTGSTFSVGTGSDYVFDYPSLSAAQTYLMIAAIPPAGSVLQTILIRKVKIEETPPPVSFTLPATTAFACGSNTTINFGVNNVYGTTGVTNYTWNLGTIPNGWLYNNLPAPATVSTSTSNSIALIPVCNTIPKNISAVVSVGGSNYNTNTSNISIIQPSLSINGDDALCSGTSTPYSIIGLPCNATLSWSLTPATGIANLSCSTCTAPTLSYVSAGTVSLNAVVTSCGTTQPQLSKNVTVGSIAPTFIPYTPICSIGVFTLCANPVSNSISHSWTARVGSTTVSLQESSDWCVDVPINTLYVDLSVTNTCNTTIKKRQFILYTNCGNSVGLSISPNPANNTLRVNATEGNSFSEIRIVDKFGNMRKQLKYPKKITQLLLNITDLPIDVYYIKIFNGATWNTVSFSKL